MSKIIQLYSDKDKKIKAYPKTIASSVYMEDGQTTIKEQLDKNVQKIKDVSLNIRDFGAKCDGISDDTVAINNTFKYLRDNNLGGKVLIPAESVVTDTIDYYNPNVKGVNIVGNGIGVSRLIWKGGSKPVFSNERLTPNNFQYNLSISDIEITARLSSSDIPTVGSVGLFVDMMRNNWTMKNVRISGFDTGLFIGVHSESGKVDKCTFSYNNIGANAYGDQADVCTFNNCWFTACKLRGVLVSSPRTVLDTCVFATDETYTDLNNYVDIQVGYQKIRDKDKNKTSYLANYSIGNGGINSTIKCCFFEGVNIVGQPCILVQNITNENIFFNNLNIESNTFALYKRDECVRIVSPKKGIKTINNKYTPENKTFMKIEGDTQWIPFVNEDVYRGVSSDLIISQDEYNALKLIENSTKFSSGGWTLNNPHSCDFYTCYEETEFDKISFSNNTGTKILSRYTHTQCPQGNLFAHLTLSSQSMNTVEVNINDGTKILKRIKCEIGEKIKDIYFKLNIDVKKLINIEITTTDSSGVLYVSSWIKHGDNSINSFILKDNDILFTNRSNQVFDIPFKTPFKKIINNLNKTENFYFDKGVIKTNLGVIQTGATSIPINSTDGVNIGAYCFFRRNIGGINYGFQGSTNVGNKITAINSNNITLENGVPFSLSDLSEIYICNVYKYSNNKL